MKVTEDAVDRLYWIQEGMLNARKLRNMKMLTDEEYILIIKLYKTGISKVITAAIKGKEATEFESD